MHCSLYNMQFHPLLRPLAKVVLGSILFALLLRRLIFIRSDLLSADLSSWELCPESPYCVYKLRAFPIFVSSSLKVYNLILSSLIHLELSLCMVRDKALISFFCIYSVLPTRIIEGAILFPMFIFASLSNSG